MGDIGDEPVPAGRIGTDQFSGAPERGQGQRVGLGGFANETAVCVWWPTEIEPVDFTKKQPDERNPDAAFDGASAC